MLRNIIFVLAFVLVSNVFAVDFEYTYEPHVNDTLKGTATFEAVSGSVMGANLIVKGLTDVGFSYRAKE